MAKRRNTTGKRKRVSTIQTANSRKTTKTKPDSCGKEPREHRRKGIPTRSPSKDDPRRGIIFSFVTLPNLDTTVHIIRRPSDFDAVESPSSTSAPPSQRSGLVNKVPLKELPETPNITSAKRDVSLPQVVY
ncbi:hypothetical protein K493DRAFT_305499 [Basidiobolus meristosporus CBS 931.73]|uniref:Uncharacterized protein n=1 Tax=Basidiobolus meristosporus CBS 931.73 TaxID=1314790 RepID=A0A1Y1XW93_9FUNG|nr:hypothetical protein K493DRAFT_305499 [Basidiobolus meristosporus CBS 931.73]|eukprot:ORX89756.1 hypothetical protein K493DRAFT_305499 [Basidiobolus meristosporus CBS 931.73]